MSWANALRAAWQMDKVKCPGNQTEGNTVGRKSLKGFAKQKGINDLMELFNFGGITPI